MLKWADPKVTNYRENNVYKSYKLISEYKSNQQTLIYILHRTMNKTFEINSQSEDKNLGLPYNEKRNLMYCRSMVQLKYCTKKS